MSGLLFFFLFKPEGIFQLCRKGRGRRRKKLLNVTRNKTGPDPFWRWGRQFLHGGREGGGLNYTQQQPKVVL